MNFFRKIFFLVVFCLSLEANSIGNPSFPSLLQEGFFIPDTSWTTPQAGFLFDLLIKKNLRSCRTSSVPTKKAKMKGNLEEGYFVWNIFERFNLEVNFGTGSLDIKWIQDHQNLKVKMTDGLFWSTSGKFILFEIKDTSFSLFGDYTGWNWMKGPAFLNGVSLAKKSRSKVKLWDAGVAFTQTYSFFAPYLGLVASRSRTNVYKLQTGDVSFHSKHLLGCIFGCTITNKSKVLLNLEGRGFFEQGFSLSFQARF